MPRAALLLRPGQHYRRNAFARGLERHGYSVSDRHERNPGPADLIVTWNRTPTVRTAAARYEAAGARVVVTENGYLGDKTFALALDHHNGAGRWFVGNHPRFPIAEEPWRHRGEHVLVLPQRGIGAPGVAMPTSWPRAVRERLARITDRPLIIRRHPGRLTVPLEPDLARAHCAVTWGSGAGIKALQAGIPVFHDLDRWIGGVAAARLVGGVEACHTPDRGDLWRVVSWAQWTLDEVESGEAFDRLLHEDDRRLFRSGQPPVADGREGDDAWRSVRGRQAAPAPLDR